MAFISVFSKATGAKHRVPEHWLDVPSIARQFNKTPRRKTADERKAAKASEPVATNTEAAIVADDLTPASGEDEEK